MSDNNRTTYTALKPTDGHKSFYGKAIVAHEPDGSETLISYGTEIITRTPDGTLIPLYNDWTATTGRHVKAFCGLSKREYFKLAGWECPTNWSCYWDRLTNEERYAYIVRAEKMCA